MGKVILSYGMGVDSTVILHRWLTDPSSRDFDLEDLIVLTAQTGDEFPDSQYLVETHMLPMMRAAGVRYVQVARDGPDQSMRILSDSRNPRRVYLKGHFRLSDELLTAGTVPQYASGSRRCSIHAKGWPLDLWIEQELQGQPFRHVIGFNADEDKRVKRDKSYSTVNRHSEYPLFDWAMGRQACEDYLEDVISEPWQKSCCFYCPFAAGREPVRIRYRIFPDLAALALLLEHMSLVLNPRMTLYTNKTLAGVIEEDGNDDALGQYRAMLSRLSYAVYHVRRIYTGVSLADRSVIPVAHGTREAMEREIGRWTHADPDEHGIVRGEIIPLEKKTISVIEKGKKKLKLLEPAVEEFFSVGPNIVPRKVAAGFEKHWPDATRGRWWPGCKAYRAALANPPGDYDYTRQETDRSDQEEYQCEMSDILPDP